MKLVLFSAMAFALAAPAVGDELNPLSPAERHQQAFDYRQTQATANKNLLPALHPTNGDETTIENFQGQFHKTLPHDNQGAVDSAAYGKLLDAVKLGTFDAFEAIPGAGKLANPLSAQAYGLEGRDSHDYGMKAAPGLSSAETAAEMVEVYWLALSRDVPFTKLATDPTVQNAVTELSSLADFTEVFRL
jgi:hypothetical protein